MQHQRKIVLCDTNASKRMELMQWIVLCFCRCCLFRHRFGFSKRMDGDTRILVRVAGAFDIYFSDRLKVQR